MGKSRKASLKAATASILLILFLIMVPAALSIEAAIPADPAYVGSGSFPTTWDGSPEKFDESLFETFGIFQLFWFAGNNLCDSATKARIESQLTQQEGKTVTCSATAGLGAYVGTCDWWCDVQASTGINCQGDSNKCSILDKCVNNACVPVTCGSNQYVSDHVCNDKLPTQTCTDSDGGNEPYSKGSVYQNGNFVASDQCSNDGRLLHENFCTTTQIPNSQDYSCTYGCSGGACNQQQSTSCTGKADGTIITSYCDTGNIAKQSVCSSGVEQATQQTCGTGYACAAGKCVVSTSCASGEERQTDGTCKKVDGGGDETGDGGGGQLSSDFVCCTYKAPDPNYVKTGALLERIPLIDVFVPRIKTEGCVGLGIKTAENSKCNIFSIVGDTGGGSQITNFTVVNNVPSIPIGRLNIASGGTLLSALCTKDSDCSSNSCEDIGTLEAELDKNAKSIVDRIDEAKKANNNQIGEGLKSGFAGKIISWVGGLFFNFDALSKSPEQQGLCIIRREGFNFGNFFEDNQTAIIIGVSVLGGLFVLSQFKK